MTEAKRRAAINKLIRDGMAMSRQFDAIDPPPTAAEAGPAGPALQSMLRRLGRDRVTGLREAGK